MLQFIIRRLLSSIPVLIGIVIVTFAIARLIPGDPCKAALGEKVSEASCVRWREEKGFNEPILVQLGIYMGDVVRGNLGDSIKYNRPVTDILLERMPMTLELASASLFLAVLVGLPLGILAAVRRNSLIDVFTMVFANLGVSIPVFFLGLMLSYFFAITLKETPFALPPSGRLPAGMVSTPFYEEWGWTLEEGSLSSSLAIFISNMWILNALITGKLDVFMAGIKHLILPAVALSTIPMSIIARMTRSSMLEVLGLDYIRTARAKGLTQQVVVVKHALRNALLPVVTVIGLQLGFLLGGAVLTETIFGLSGVGRALYDAITGRDFPIMQALTLVVAVIFVFANLIVDVSYAVLNPRIRLS